MENRGPEPTALRYFSVTGSSRPLLACLVPVRNGAAHLDGWITSVEQFADCAVALDDGSTDDTRARLETSSFVARVLTNEVRPTYRGWNDSENRNRLLEAVDEIEPRWVMFLDVDERIPHDDASVLRAFLSQEADSDAGYLFRVYRMISDLEHYDRASKWFGRLFAYRPGLRLADQHLHPWPLPTSIPKSHWRRTTIRIQHLAGLNQEHRRARFQKYQQVDPDRTYQDDYSNLLDPPGRIREWWNRSPRLAVLANDPVPDPSALDHETTPTLSVIVIATNDEARIEAAVTAIVHQDCPEPFEVIVVTSGSDGTARIVRERFPAVRVIELDRPALPGEARNAGLRVSRGRYVSFPGSHVEIQPGSLAGRIRVHRLGYAMVTGTMFNGTLSRSGWASYFLDNTAALPGRPSGQLDVHPLRCSYLREALVEIGGFPEDMRAGEDTVVNGELFARGYSAYRTQDVGLVHHTPCRHVATLMRHHFVRGRGMGRILLEDALGGEGFPNRRIIRFAAFGALSRLRVMTRRVNDWGGNLQSRYWRSLPLVTVGAASWWLGACYELACRGPAVYQRVPRTARRRSRRLLARRSTRGVHLRE